MSTTPFQGLTMPVFTAFGWLGQEAAVSFALEQLSLFSQNLHTNLSRSTQIIFPHFGLDKDTQGVYLARTNNITDDLYFTFFAKPMALRMGINLNNQDAVGKGLKAIQNDLTSWINGLHSLQGDWEIHAQQLEHNPETGVTMHYKDLFKDKPSALSARQSADLIERMIYLHDEPKWHTSLVISKKWPSQFIAGMGESVSSQLASELDSISPLLRLLAGGIKEAKVKAPAKKKRAVKKRSKATSASAVQENQIEQFTYNAILKPLHIRKGFINMTPAHWPFFSISSRTEVRDVVMRYEANVDKECAVWRMVPNDRARVMLSDKAQRWLADNFSPEDEVQISAIKHGTVIELELNPVQE